METAKRIFFRVNLTSTIKMFPFLMGISCIILYLYSSPDLRLRDIPSGKE